MFVKLMRMLAVMPLSLALCGEADALFVSKAAKERKKTMCRT